MNDIFKNRSAGWLTQKEIREIQQQKNRNQLTKTVYGNKIGRWK